MRICGRRLVFALVVVLPIHIEYELPVRAVAM